MTDKDGPEICIVNESWFLEDQLLWPPKNLRKMKQSKFLSLVPTSDWLQFTEFKILKRGIKTIETANERLNFYCLYENSLDKIKQDAEKEQRRLHPVRYIEAHLDHNSLFDDLKEGSTSTPNVSLANKQNNGQSTLCSLCGSWKPSIKCDSCAKILCITCDDMYHKHPVRNHHSRQELKTKSSVPKNLKEPRKENQAQPSTSKKVLNSMETDDQYFIIPRNRGKANKGTQNKQTKESEAKFASSAGLTKAPGRSNFIQSKENQNEEESMLTANEQNSRRNVDIVLKREAELQTLSGNSNNIEEPKNQAKTVPAKNCKMVKTAKRMPQALSSGSSKKKPMANCGDNKAKTITPKNDKLVKSSANRTPQALSSGSSKVNPIADCGNNKVKTIRVKNEKLMKSSPQPTPQTMSSGSPKIKPMADSGDNKISKKTPINFQSILICAICGSMAKIKCDQCNSVVFCANCDMSYHSHMLRKEHLRQLIQDERETANRETEKPESETEKQETDTELMNTAEDHSAADQQTQSLPSPLHAEPASSHKQRRPPPPLLLIPIANLSKTGSLLEQTCNTSIGCFEDNQVKSLKNQGECNNIRRSSFEGEHVDSFPSEDDEITPYQDRDMEVASNEVSSDHAISPITQKVQVR